MGVRVGVEGCTPEQRLQAHAVCRVAGYPARCGQCDSPLVGVAGSGADVIQIVLRPVETGRGRRVKDNSGTGKTGGRETLTSRTHVETIQALRRQIRFCELARQ